MELKIDKQADGTYTIWDTDGGREILLDGVRGCNLNRTINELHYKEFEDK